MMADLILPLTDRDGIPMFRCAFCDVPLGAKDLNDIGLRAPDPGESRDEYIDAELIDRFEHLACVRAAKTG